MKSRLTPRAVVFDMDGVLIDARDWHYRALNDALAIFGTQISSEEHYSEFNGLPTRVKLEMLKDRGRLPMHLDKVIDEVKQERTLREAASLCFPRVEHLLMMSWLRQRKCLIGVATNSIRNTSSTMLEFAGLLTSIDVLVTNEDVSQPKPSPEIYLKASEQLGVGTQEILVIEDHPYGVAAAESAGCTVIRVEGVTEVSTALLQPYFEFESL